MSAAPTDIVASTAGLGSRFVRLQRATLFAAAAAAFSAVAVGQSLPTWAIAGFGAAWVTGLFIREQPWRVFATTVNLATVIGVVLLLAPAARDREQLPVAAAETALLLCSNRLLVRRSAWDDGMLHLSCWLVLASGAALTGELSYGLCLLLYAAFAAVSMTLAELRRGIEEEAPEQAQSLFAAPELTSRRLWLFSASLGLFSAAFGAVVFPLFPRAQLGYLHNLGIGPASTGLSDRVDLSNGSGTLQDSSKLVLQADLKGDLSLARYWRALTLQHFTGRGWSPGQGAAQIISGVNHRGQLAKMHGTFEFFADGSRLVPVPKELAQLWPMEPGIRLRTSEPGDLRLVFSAPQREQFTVAAGGAKPDQPSAVDLALDLQLPELSPAITTLARQLIPDGTSAQQAIDNVERYFTGFRYSRELHASQTPIEDFLQRRNGHCELFASATAVLLRARGIPARYVAGFYPDDASDGKLTIREWDAHAWAEAYVPGKGFVLVDTTPPELRGARLSHTAFWQHLLDLWDNAELGWLHSIVDFDAHSQERSAGWLTYHLLMLVRSLLSPSLATLLRLLLLALGVGAVYALIRLPRRRTAALRLEQALFKRLAARGLPRAPSDTYEEALDKIRRRDAALARETEAILNRLAAARFGGKALAGGETEALRSRIQRIG